MVKNKSRKPPNPTHFHVGIVQFPIFHCPAAMICPVHPCTGVVCLCSKLIGFDNGQPFRCNFLMVRSGAACGGSTGTRFTEFYALGLT
jgi:hypothetical protein